MPATPELLHLYRSAGHNFVGRHGLSPRQHPMETVTELDCRAGLGVVGDRFFGHGTDFKGQITFFAWEVHESLQVTFGLDQEPGVYRRNVITRGLTLGDLIGREFSLQGVRFAGMEECRPCYWMDQVCAAGAEEFLRGQGGLRARILSDGILRLGPVEPA